MPNEIFEGYFYNPSRGNLSFEETIKEILNWLQEHPKESYEIVVGCDSPSSEEPFFPLAIVVLRKGQGGRFFLKKMRYRKKFGNWKNRILQEVLLSCELALKLREVMKEKIKLFPSELKYEFKYIHADVGVNGATKDMIKEVIGIIQGNGFEAKIKPDSYVASSVADRYT